MAGADHTLMAREAAQAPDAVARQLAHNRPMVAELAQRLRRRPPHLVVTCARGSSDHAATYAKYLIETRTGVVTASTAPSVSSIYETEPQLHGALFLAISQSGQSPDLLAATAKAKAAGALTVALVNVEDSPLAATCEAVLPLRAGPEESVAATKSCIAAFAAVLDLTAAWAGDPGLARALSGLPRELEAARDQDWSAAVEPLREARDLYVVGRGLGFAAAQEAALKLKETCGLHAEAFSAAEVRHGPLALVGEGFPLLAFAQDDETAESVYTLARDVAARGAKVMMAGSRRIGDRALPVAAADPAVQPMLALQSFYRLAADLAVMRGFDPDRPPNLRKVTETH